VKIHTLWGWERHSPVPIALEIMDEVTASIETAGVPIWTNLVAIRMAFWSSRGYYDFFERVIDVADKAILNGSDATVVGAVVPQRRPELPPNAVLSPDGSVRPL
jgi:hypothetical protein